MNANAKALIRYIFPALGGLFVTYLYNVVDGIFVGQGVGSAALGAVNIAVPFISFVVAVTAMFPMGGATVVAIRMGRGDKERANHAFMTAFSLTLLMAAVLTVVGMVFSRQIVDISGAKNLSPKMRGMAAQYLFYYSAFSIPMLMGTCLSVFVRNDGSPTLSFVGMCAGTAAAAVRAVLYPHSAESHLHGVLLLHQAHRHGKCHRHQPRHCRQGAADLLPAAGFWYGDHLDRALCYRGHYPGRRHRAE